MEGRRTDKEVVDYVKEHIESDLRANRALNGIDFSEFLGAYLMACAGKKLFFSSDTPETLQHLVMHGLGTAAMTLETELEKPVVFNESIKAGFAISQMWNHDVIEEIDEYASNLQIRAEREYKDVNLRAIRYFSS